MSFLACDQIIDPDTRITLFLVEPGIENQLTAVRSPDEKTSIRGKPRCMFHNVVIAFPQRPQDLTRLRADGVDLERSFKPVSDSSFLTQREG